VPITREALPDGSTLFVVGNDALGGAVGGFLLQCVVLSSQGMIATINIQGKGDAHYQWTRFRPCFRTIRWLQDS